MTDGKDDLAGSRVRRRNRMITSCLECRRRKLKCDKLHPCTNCNKFSRECMFLAPALDSVSQKKLNELKEKMGSLERTLEDDVARRGPRSKSSRTRDRRSSTDLPGEETESDEDALVPDDERELEATPMASVDAAYEDDANEDVLDLGFRVGRFRMTERLGGLFRPMIADEMKSALIREDKEGTELEAPLRDNQESFLDPGQNFIAPGSGFIFGDIGSRRSLIDFLPPKVVADVLIQKYYANVHFVARVVHWPSFQVQYDNFWSMVLSGVEPSPSLQSIIFSILFVTVASMSENEVTAVFQSPKRPVLVNFQTGTEVALGKAHILRATKLETLQALVIYLIPMCRNEVSRAHSVLVGTAIRLGECFGLHRDPAEVFGMPPVECHVRRILWFQLCFLDFRTAEAQGPRPTVKREDYDTKLPCNVDDYELLTLQEAQDKENVWTDMTLSRMRFEATEMHRVVWHDRNKLEKKKVSITYCLGRIESFRKAMEAKYGFLDVSIPIQHYARLLLDVLLLRMHIMILHKYHNSTSTRIPDRLRQIVISSGTKTSESAVLLDKLPQFEPWRWYNGALQQWHTAFLLLMEVFIFPNRREAERIWAIVDFVFEPDQTLSRAQKARSIMAAVRDRAAAYRNLRKMREPVSMKNRLFTTMPQSKKGQEIVMPILSANQAARVTRQNQSQAPEMQVSSGSTIPGAPNEVMSGGSSRQPGQVNAINRDSEQQTDGSWSFDNPQTLFVLTRPYRESSSSPASNIANDFATTPDPRNYLASSTTTLAHLEPSPGSSSMVSDSWPPFITPNQHGWRSSYSANANAHPTSPSYQHHGRSSSTSMSPPPGTMFGNSAMGLVSGQYIPDPKYSPSPAPLSPTQVVPVQSSMPYLHQEPGAVRTGQGTNSNSNVNAHATTGVGTGMGVVRSGMNQGNTGQSSDLVDSDQLMLDIDWGEWDKLFPPDINTGNLDLPTNAGGG